MIYLFRHAASGALQFYIYESDHNQVGGNFNTTLNTNKWSHIAAVADGSKLRIYVNGVADSTTYDYDGTLNSDATDSIYIAHYDTFYFNGAIDEVRIYNAALTSAEVARHYNGDFSQDPTGNLVMLHHFEEGMACDLDNEANCLTDDSPDGNNDGTLKNFNALTSYDNGTDGWITTVKKPKLRWETGKFASAGNFDGGGDRVYQAYDSAFDFTTKSFTISSWFKHNTIATSNDYLLSRYDNDQGYKIWMDNSGDMCFGIDDDATWGPDDSACTTGIDYDDNQWHHLTAYKDGTSAIYLYIDSVLVASDVSLVATATLTSNSASFNIGSDAGVGSEAPNASYYINTWEGEIDDMKVYGYARSADEIRLDYNAGFAAKFGPAGKSCSEDPAACMDYGLVASYNMDEGSGDTLYDQSDSGNDGVLTNGPKWTTGHAVSGGYGRHGVSSGSALSFDGTNDYINCGNDSSLDITEAITIEAWVKPNEDGVYEGIVEKGPLGSAFGPYEIHLNDANNVYFSVNTNAKNVISTGTVTVADGWRHIIATYDKEYLKIYINGQLSCTPVAYTTAISTSNDDIRIGVYHSTAFYFNGSIDGVKIYNRALSAEEVRYHYNRGGPVLQYKFNEGSGQKAYDSAGDAHAQLGVNASSSGDSNDPSWGRP